jgi:hypothetical protein
LEGCGVIPPESRGFLASLSRQQPFLLFDAQVSSNTFKHHPGGDLSEFFGLDFV